MGFKEKAFKINTHKKASVTKFKGKLYCHFSDQFSRKNVTFNYNELKKLKKILPSLLDIIKKYEGKKQKKSLRHPTKWKTVVTPLTIPHLKAAILSQNNEVT